MQLTLAEHKRFSQNSDVGYGDWVMQQNRFRRDTPVRLARASSPTNAEERADESQGYAATPHCMCTVARTRSSDGDGVKTQGLRRPQL
jgi:hypothetical protein